MPWFLFGVYLCRVTFLFGLYFLYFIYVYFVSICLMIFGGNRIKESVSIFEISLTAVVGYTEEEMAVSVIVGLAVKGQLSRYKFPFGLYDIDV